MDNGDDANLKCLDFSMEFCIADHRILYTTLTTLKVYRLFVGWVHIFLGNILFKVQIISEKAAARYYF